MVKLHARVTREIEVTEEQANRLLDALLGKEEDPELEDITELFTEGIESGNYEMGYIPFEWAIADLKELASESEINLLKDGLPITGDIDL